MAGYMVVGAAIRFFAGQEQRTIATQVSDAALFASSSALLLTGYFPAMLPAVGSLTPYLVFGGFCGLMASIVGLLPEKRRTKNDS